MDPGRIALLCAALMVFPGCRARTEPPTAPARRAHTDATLDAGAPARYLLTPEKLAAFTRYEDRVAGLFATGPQSPGGTGETESTAKVTAAAIEEARARAQSGLALDELDLIEQMVSQVLARRQQAMAVDAEQTLELMTRLKQALGPEKQAAVAQAMTETARLRDEALQLTRERIEYGDANVDLLLGAEAELRRIETLGRTELSPQNGKKARH